jgi:RNA ligase (TIGR02306 family)
MKHTWGKKLLYLFYGRKGDKKNGWPEWVKKTDEERVQNMPWILEDKSEWFATEKIDGTSSTYTMRGRGRKREFYICSRNVCFDTPEKMATGAYYDTNVYQEMGIKYNIEDVLASLMDVDETLDFVTIQGETYGEGIQKRDYGLKGHDFMAFNLIFGYKDGRKERLNPQEMTEILTGYGVPCVPIVDEHFVMPDTVEELLAIATDKSAVDGGMREGLVFRSADGVKSFKAVSNEFLLKYHNN